MKNEKQKMKCCPQESIFRGNVQNTDRSVTLFIGLSGKRYVEEWFVQITDQDSEAEKDNKTTSDVRLFQPLT